MGVLLSGCVLPGNATSWDTAPDVGRTTFTVGTAARSVLTPRVVSAWARSRMPEKMTVPRTRTAAARPAHNQGDDGFDGAELGCSASVWGTSDGLLSMVFMLVSICIRRDYA